MEVNLNHLWLIVSACFVFFMQAGFVCYEVGFIQSKNVVSVAIENILTFIITTLVFSFLGFALMFGPGPWGLFGGHYWLLNNLAQAHNSLGFVFVFFELMFAGTAVTIVSGSMSERTRLLPLLLAAVFLAGFIYPLFGHWVWGDLFQNQSAWLKNLGFMDFAGATVVHATAGWVSLAGIIVVGPRKDKWDEEGKIKKLGRSNIPFAALGTFILWFSWFGFNGGSLLEFNDRIGLILLNTNFSAAAGVVGAILTTRFFIRDHSYMEAIFAGALGGLVAITASSNYLEPLAAVMVGFISGSVVVLAGLLLEKLGLDDAVGAVPIHGFGGAAGTILLAFFASPQFLGGQSRWVKFLVQLLGVTVNFVWSFGLGLLMFYLIKKKFGLRVTEEEEEKGLNIVEFGDIYSWQEYLKITHYENLTQDLSGKIQQQNQLLQKQAKLLAETQEHERVKLARDLHDGVGQSLAALKLQLGLIANKVRTEEKDPALSEQVERTVRLTTETIEEIRGVLFNLKPGILQKRGLKSAIEELLKTLGKTSGIRYEFSLSADLPPWEDTAQLNLYRVIQECLANILKHAEATEVMLHFSRLRSDLYLFQISDNGRGFNPDEIHTGLGLSSMQERLKMLGGRLQIITAESRGTSILMEVPYDG
ncbi:ammonia channel precursor [Peptococcaceae bacterium CEB3]|nr:ammonia channel precursor [Peptococcaceae bacterium CEB3]